MTKFNEGDVAYFQKSTNHFVKYYVAEQDGDIVYMDDDTDIPVSKLLSEEEYEAKSKKAFNFPPKVRPNGRMNYNAINQYDPSKDNLFAYLSKVASKDISFNKKVLHVLIKTDKLLIDFVAYKTTKYILERSGESELLNDILTSTTEVFMEGLDSYQQMLFVEAFTGIPLTVYQEFYQQEEYLRMTLLKARLNNVDELLRWKVITLANCVEIENV